MYRLLLAAGLAAIACFALLHRPSPQFFAAQAAAAIPQKAAIASHAVSSRLVVPMTMVSPAEAHERQEQSEVATVPLVSLWSRRSVLASAAGTGAILLAPLAARAVAARTGMSSPFTWEYEDPNHPGCLRSVKVVGPKLGPDGRRGRNPVAFISGVDGLPAGTKACPPGAVPELKDVEARGQGLGGRRLDRY